jgi:hypothetical protein
VSSRNEPTRELGELLSKRMFLGDSALNELEENFLQYVIHYINENVCRGVEGVRFPRARGV